jgi:hypothetical protein
MATSAVRELRQIPFGILIGQPLKAVVEAQALAAQTTVDFIKEVGFQRTEPNDFDALFDEQDPNFGDLRYVEFQYDRRNDDGTEGSARLRVPLLSILPIPLLRVDETTINFKAKLTDAHVSSKKNETTIEASQSGSISANYFFAKARVSFRSSISHNTTTTQASRYNREYTMDIFVRAVQDDIPAGLAKVFQILEDTIQEKTEGGSSPAPAPSP